MTLRNLATLRMPPLAIFALIALATLFGVASPARAIICIICPPPPPIAVLLIVDTATYPGVNGDGKCSLDEAIWAADNNGVGDPTAGSCSANASHTLAVINFSLGSGTPTINMTSFTQPITAKVSINGNTGGATRVELHGPGPSTGTGLDVSGSGAAGTTIRNLVINNFATGIYLENSTTGITIAGNYIGTNAAGTAAMPNRDGIYVYYGTAQIGGLNGVTPGGSCTGDCNLISGNTRYGVDMHEDAYGTIEGNFVGSDVTGTAALGNGNAGVRSGQFSTATIGGTAGGAGNLVSGNKYGIDIYQSQPVIKGNFVGTNASGSAAIPNTSAGVYVEVGANNINAFTIGGSGAGDGNLVSGNNGPGVEFNSAKVVALAGNLIGTQADGVSPLGNSGDGIQLDSDTVHSVQVGGVNAGEGNTIAFNGADGVYVSNYSDYDSIRGNSIHDNAGKGIALAPDADPYVAGNDALAAPSVTGSGPITGTACANCSVDVFSDAGDEGKVFEGTITADGGGNWSFANPVSGPRVTATNTTSSGNTSEFSAPYTLPATPTPSPSPSPTPTASPTPSATPTAKAAPTPSPTPTATASPSASHTPAPTHTSSGYEQGDANCDGDIDPDDALVILEETSGAHASCTRPATVHLGPADVNCDGDVDGLDALDILRHLAGESEVQLPTGCPQVGQTVVS